MVDNPIYQQTSELLDLLETELGNARLLSTEQPSKEAMNSQAPFACDTMSFEAWLQFIFLPRMRVMVSQNSPLPSNIAIAPMAEQVYQSRTDLLNVIDVLHQIDSLLGGH